MRWFSSALLVALLVVPLSTTAPAPAQAAGLISGGGEMSQGIPHITPEHTLAAKTKKSKKKDKKKKTPAPSTPTFNVPVSTGPGPIPVTVNPLKNPLIGERDVYVRSVTSTPGLSCRLTVKYSTGDQAPVADITQDASNACVFHFNVPNDAKLIGDAGVIVAVFAPSDPATILGMGSVPFSVKNVKVVKNEKDEKDEKKKKK